MTFAYPMQILDWICRKLVNIIQTITGAEIPREKVKIHTQRESIENIDYENDKPEDGIINEKATLSKKTFPISEADLIAQTKKLLSEKADFGSKMPELLSDDFQFVFPIVGPLSKTEFCAAYPTFKVREAFPDIKYNYFGLTVDPMEPNRVWFFSRATQTHTGTLTFFKNIYPPTGTKIVNTPQAFSMTFDTEGRCYRFTGGYSVDKSTGNCGGLGGLFGMIYCTGKNLPFPEGKPWKPSLEWEALSKRLPLIGKALSNK